MKKVSCFLLILALLICLGSCRSPNTLQLDIYKGASTELKLLHVNASDAARKQQIEGITQAILKAEPTDKPLDLFAFYPDYTISVTDPANPQARLTVVLDLNGEWVEFYYPEENSVIYRSEITAAAFSALVNMNY